ncbi:MAG: cation:proton antiporter [Treponema sp.]|nr:cation:proton antiporter [Treponema sp.]
MLSLIYQNRSSPSSIAVLSISIMLLAGFLLTRLTKKIRVPNVTGYIIAGILIGPFALNLLPKTVIESTAFLPDIALAFIAFNAGQFFSINSLKKNVSSIIVITIFESVFASILVLFVSFFILKLDLAFCIVLSSLASATAPASTMMTIRQTGAKGEYVETLLQVVAFDDVVGLISYSVAIALAMHIYSSASFSFTHIVVPLFSNILVMALGAFFGLVLKLSFMGKRSTDNRLIIALALLFAFCGICTFFDVSPLLGCMTMGMTYINISHDDKLFKQLAYFSPPILLLFFVRSGMAFNINLLTNSSTVIGKSPLLLVSVFYFFVRIIGKYVGAFLGSLLTKKSLSIRNYLGLALIPQAGVAIGLSSLGARIIGGEKGLSLQTVILASSVLYEIIGPACAKLGLYLSGSYSNKLEDLVSVQEVTESGEEKTQLELLIERIQKIQEDLPTHSISEEEAAYTEAAESYFGSLSRGERSKNNISRPRRKSK